MKIKYYPIKKSYKSVSFDEFVKFHKEYPRKLRIEFNDVSDDWRFRDEELGEDNIVAYTEKCVISTDEEYPYDFIMKKFYMILENYEEIYDSRRVWLVKLYSYKKKISREIKKILGEMQKIWDYMMEGV